MEMRTGDSDTGQIIKPSMRPRPFGHGNDATTRTRFFLLARLQCGHDLSAMEIVSAIIDALREGTLQCGHDLSAMEMLVITLLNRLYSFLQCGHDLSAMEIKIAGAIHALATFLQCGHDLSAMEMPTTAATSGWPARPFNAATTFRPWKW